MSRLLDETLRTGAPGKILIVKPSSLGDIVHSLPFLETVRSHFPGAAIHWVVAKGFEGLLDGHQMIDKLWVINKDGWKRIGNVKGTAGEIKTLFASMKRERYDLTVDLQGLLRSGVITRASGAPVRIGFREAREGSRFFYTHEVEGGRDIHAVDRYLKIAEFLGCDISEVRFPFPATSLPSTLSVEGPYAVVIPGARWRTKIWPAEYFGEVSARLPLKSVVVGSGTDRATADKIVALSKGKAVSLAGRTTLKELIAVIGGARFVLTTDSGPMHIAAALGVPVFAVFGPTDPVRTGPYGKGHAVISADVSCSPCFRKECNDMKCMRELPAEKVLETIRGRLLRVS